MRVTEKGRDEGRKEKRREVGKARDELDGPCAAAVDVGAVLWRD